VGQIGNVPMLAVQIKAQKLNPWDPNWHFLITSYDYYGMEQYENAHCQTKILVIF